MNYVPTAACIAAAKDAAKGALTDAEINQAFQKVYEESEKLKASGNTANMAERLTQKILQETERARIAAALQKRHEALNILTFDRLLETTNKLKAAGMKPHEALLTLMRGRESGAEGSRVSVDANTLSYRGMFLGDMFAQMQRERPQVEAMLADRNFDNDVVREMMELREGGSPGVTKNEDAKYIAKVFATYAELSRVQLNKLGASIGKLDGWAGAQTHDDIKLIQAGKPKWVEEIRQLLDVRRTFTEAQSEAEIRDILEDVYDTITTGISSKPIARQDAGRVNPANLAKSLGKERVLHFKDAASVIAYRDKYGYGNTASSIMAHQTKAAKLAAAMQMFGPNPENMVMKLADRMARDIRDDVKMSPAEKQKLLKNLRTDGGGIRTAMDIMSGLTSRPVNADMAQLGSNIRAVQSMAKLGGATISSAPADVVTNAIASQFRGSGFWKGLTDHLGGILQGRPKGEQKEITYLLGEGYEGIIGHINADAVANDAPLGKMSALMEKFFKWNGMTWWDTIGRATSVRTIAAEMGMRAKTEFAKLPKAYQHVLGLHGIDEARWNVIRQAEAKLSNGNSYILGDSMRDLSDETVHPLIADELTKADAALIKRQSDRAAKSAQEQEWVNKRALKIEAWMGRMEARLEDRIKTMKGERDAGLDELRQRLGDVRQSLSDVKASLLDGDVTARMAGRAEGKGARDISALQSKMDALDRQFQRVGKDKAAQLHADYVERQGDLKEFSDRMQRYADARSEAGKADVAAQEQRIKDIYDSARFGLEMKIRSFVADESRYGMISTDARSRAVSTLGTRPGTIAGEAIRFIMQFKGFPIAFTQRVLGRAIYAQRRDASMWEKGAHMGAIVSGLGFAGYMAMAMKDALKGHWPPRDPTDWKTMIAAFQQGGALGIYGDYLFGQSSRFGNTALETAAGPTIGTASDIVNTLLKTRDYAAGKLEGGRASSPAAQWISLLQGSTPFANLFYTKPALDYLILNSVRDWATPGATERAVRQRYKDYGQTTWGQR